MVYFFLLLKKQTENVVFTLAQRFLLEWLSLSNFCDKIFVILKIKNAHKIHTTKGCIKNVHESTF